MSVHTDLYDNQYPDGIAGHVEAGSFITDDGLVNTTEGPDILFNGEDVDRIDPPRRMKNAGTENVNRRIGEAVRQGKEKGDRTPVSTSSDSWQTGNVVLADGNATRILIASPNRKNVTIGNQSAGGVVYIGRDSGLKIAGPNTCFLPLATTRVFTHTQEIWVVGVAGQIVDWVEENYS